MKSMRLIPPFLQYWATEANVCASVLCVMELGFFLFFAVKYVEYFLKVATNSFPNVANEKTVLTPMRLQVAHLGIVIFHGLHLAIIFITASVQLRDEISIKMTCCFVTFTASPYEMIGLFSYQVLLMLWICAAQASTDVPAFYVDFFLKRNE